jgi:hypothetical protein
MIRNGSLLLGLPALGGEGDGALMDRQNNSVEAAAFPGMIEQKEEGLPGDDSPGDAAVGRVRGTGDGSTVITPTATGLFLYR